MTVSSTGRHPTGHVTALRAAVVTAAPGVALAVPAVAAGDSDAAAAHTQVAAMAASSATAPKTTITLRFNTCNRCPVRLVQALKDPVSY